MSYVCCVSVLVCLRCAPGLETRGCVRHVQAVEHPASPRGRGALPAEDAEGPEAGVPGPLPHPLALRLPVSRRSLEVQDRGPQRKEAHQLLFFNRSIKTGSLFWFSPRRGDAPFPKKEDGSLLYDDIDYKLTWTAMEKLVGKGLVRAIGLSNFNSRQIDDVLSVATIKPTVLQVGWGSVWW